MFLEVTKSYGIIPNGLKIKKDPCIVNVSKNFVASWDMQLFKAEIRLMEILNLKHVRKLFAIISITRDRKNGFFELEIIWKSWKKQNVGENSRSSVNFRIMKLCVLNVWNFESHFEFFSFKFNFLEFCNNFVPKFENLYYLLHLNTNESIKESSSENSESNQDCSQNSRMRGDWE